MAYSLTEQLLAEAKARQIRAFAMADRMHQMNNKKSEQAWLAEVDKQQIVIDKLEFPEENE